MNMKKPSSLFELHSRLASFQYNSMFIPFLKHISYPLHFLLRKGQFTWGPIEEQSWNMLKAVSTLGLRLTIPEPHENLVLATDASKIAASACLFRDRGGVLELVAVNSKYFSTTDLNKCSYMLESIALSFGLKTYASYILNCEATVKIFTDAKALIYAKRNSTHSILLNSTLTYLQNFVSLVNVEIYHVPGTVNVLADVMSRAISDNINCALPREHPISKEWAKVLPPIPDNFSVTKETLFKFLTETLEPEPQDLHDRKHKKLMEPKTVQELFDLSKTVSDEQRYYNAIRLLEQWNDKYIKSEMVRTNFVKTYSESLKHHNRVSFDNDNVVGCEFSNPNADLAIRVNQARLELDLLKQAECFKILDEIMDSLYGTIKGSALYKRILENLQEASKKFLYVKEGELTEENVKAFNLSIDNLFATCQEADRVFIEHNAQKNLITAYCNVDNISNCSSGNKLDIFEMKHRNADSKIREVIQNIESSEAASCVSRTNCSASYRSGLDLPSYKSVKPSLQIPRRGNVPLGTKDLSVHTLETKASAKPRVLFQMKPGSTFKPKICSFSNGLDLPLQEDLTLRPNELAKVDLGIKLLIPKNYCAFLMGKSSARVKYGLQIYIGLIDVGYKDYLQVVIQNMSMDDVTLIKGTAVSQFLLLKAKIPTFEEGWDDLLDSENRGGGFGSTGQNFERIDSQEKVSFLPVENENNFLHIKGIVDEINPSMFTLDFMHIFVTGDTPDKMETFNELLEYERSLMCGSSINMMASLPSLSCNTLTPMGEIDQCKLADPDNWRGDDGSYPKLNPREMSALLAADLNDNYKLSVETLIELQNNERRMSRIKEDLVGNPKSHKYFSLMKGVLCREYNVANNTISHWAVYIPTSILYAVVIYIHKHYLHPSKTQTLKEFQCLYYHPFARKAVQMVCDSCLVCTQSRNAEKRRIPIGKQRTLKPLKPRESISMDILYFPPSNKGYKYGLIIADLFSLYISFYPMKTKNSTEVAKCVRAYFSAHCPPSSVYTDNDPGFRGECETLFRLYKVTHHTSYPFTQKENYVESQVRTFKNAYRAAIVDSPVFKTRDWDTLYPLIVCRINCMISKYGMSREAVHYGQIVESSLPLITDSAVFEPLEKDLEKVANDFRKKMGRFMQQRNRNKTYYKIGKKFQFYINELVMYRVYTPASMLEPTFTGPARIVDLAEMGATLRDTKTGTQFSVAFDNLRKINFDELLTLLPQNFDSEIAETIGNYRYRRSDRSDDYAVASDTDDDSGFEDSEKTTLPPDRGKTRSGKVYLVKPENFPKKLKKAVKICHLRMVVIPKVPSHNFMPHGPCLKYRFENRKFTFPDPDPIWKIGSYEYNNHLTEKTLERIKSFRDKAQSSAFQSGKKCVLDFRPKRKGDPKKLRFGNIQVIFYEDENNSENQE
ncbi:MAG: RNase H-like domain-containing protein [Anaerovoracaceae bacterium]